MMKLVVEVVEACDLIPKDGEGSATAFVEVDFENQRARTHAVGKTLNPAWNQKLSFPIDTAESIKKQSIEVSVYNELKCFPYRNFLGRVRIPGSDIVQRGEEVLRRFQLERKWFFSYVRGEISLKIYISPEPKTPPVEIEREKQSKGEEVGEAKKVVTTRHIGRQQVSSTSSVQVVMKPSTASGEEYKLKEAKLQLERTMADRRQAGEYLRPCGADEFSLCPRREGEGPAN
ncbi:hypothetical protein HPP92_018341 [Vanilla planifolia]|uniref:C2 domain-containing protein n=1 Tax=Vanilla planifolia TaxID=51239 RepID=A0A835UPE6_VANPL|nr:hypothetical protein HPP92_018341 [Vanilla planifolia]